MIELKVEGDKVVCTYPEGSTDRRLLIIQTAKGLEFLLKTYINMFSDDGKIINSSELLTSVLNILAMYGIYEKEPEEENSERE